MPELPEVETVCRGLRVPLVGARLDQVIVRRGDLRRAVPEDFGQRLTGRRVTAVDRRAKYILIGLESGDALLAHLGMSGRMVIHDRPPEAFDRHDHIVLVTDRGGAVIFNDPRRFGLMDIVAFDRLDTHPLLAGLGPDPFADGFTESYLAGALAGRAAPLKAVLLDQRVIAGLGNIYVSEALYRAGLSPRRRAGSVAGVRVRRLFGAIRAVLSDAIAAGGSSLRDYVQASGELGYFQHSFRVYGRAGARCPVDAPGHEIRRIVQSNRSTFYCPRCQR